MAMAMAMAVSGSICGRGEEKTKKFEFGKRSCQKGEGAARFAPRGTTTWTWNHMPFVHLWQVSLLVYVTLSYSLCAREIHTSFDKSYPWVYTGGSHVARTKTNNKYVHGEVLSDRQHSRIFLNGKYADKAHKHHDPVLLIS